MAVFPSRHAGGPGPASHSNLLRALAGSAACLGLHAAQAQPAACEQFKATLAARLSAHPSTYTLEAVPSGTALPPGDKVVGNCGGGAWKVLMRRGNPPPLVAGPGTEAAVTADVPPAPPPARLAASAPAPAIAPAPSPVAPSVVASPPAPAAPVRPSSDPAPAPPATVVAAAPTALTDASPGGPSEAPSSPADDSPSWLDDAAARATALAASHAAWAAPLVLLPLLWFGWAWFVRRRDYDEAGLPRGPRL